MRVLQFGRWWNHLNGEIGGVQSHAALLSRGLASHGLDVVNLVAGSKFQAEDFLVDGYRQVVAPSFGKAFSTAIAPALVLRALALHREQPFDLFHLHFPDPLTHLTSLVLPAHVPRVITWHSDIVSQKRLLWFYRPLLRRTAHQAAALVAATQAHFDTSPLIPADIPSERKHVIPYGFDFASLQLSTRTTVLRDSLVHKAQGRGLIFSLGRHVSYKGFDVLLRALQHTQAFLLLGGDGPLRVELQRLAVELGVADRVDFCGRIPEDDLAAYFHACDVFCLPSVTTMEAFGLVQVEAFACGKPVVCTQLGNGVNAVNVHGDTGLAVPARDPSALSQALNRLLNDSALRETLGLAGMKKAQNEYSLQAMASAHVRLYRSLLAETQDNMER